MSSSFAIRSSHPEGSPVVSRFRAVSTYGTVVTPSEASTLDVTIRRGGVRVWSRTGITGLGDVVTALKKGAEWEKGGKGYNFAFRLDPAAFAEGSPPNFSLQAGRRYHVVYTLHTDNLGDVVLEHYATIG